MKDLIHCIKAAALGAVAMYYLDPDSGRRRRAHLNDRLRSACSDLSHCLQGEARHVADRLHGAAAERHASTAAGAVDDEILVERIRAALGHVVSSRGAIDVSVNDGIASLAGQVLAAEHESVLGTVKAVPGVRAVADHLTVHDEPGAVPGLQGGSPS
ncbi:BON domain-containing protein [Achromobacter aloeverae]|nr:BON domain-containing protein [Achromobacter aloeverae]